MKNLNTLVKKKPVFPIFFSIAMLLVFFGMVNLSSGENIISSGTTLKVTSGTMLVSMESLTIKSGAVVDNSGTLILKKNLSNENAAATSLGSGTVECSGTVSQALNGKNIIQNLTINNAAGITNGGENKVNGVLTLTSGLLNLGANNFLLGSAATVVGGSVTAMLVPTGAGQVRKTYSGIGSFTFPVGDNTSTNEYSPVTLNFTGGTFGGGNYVGLNLVNAQYPGSPASGSFLKRYWNVSQSGITGFSCNSMFQYVPADVNGTENLIYCVRITPTSVNYFNVTNTALHQLTANALTTFGTFTGFQTLTDKSLNLTAFLEGLYISSGTMRKAQNGTGNQFPGTTADQVTIELHNSASYATIAYTFNNVNLSTAGAIAAAVPGILSGSYYVTIKNRNSIETTTAAAVSFGSSPINYNFSNLASKAYGSNMKLMTGGYWAFFGGDVTQDGLVDSGDMIPVDNANNFFTTGYIPEDVTGDGLVDSSDMNIVDNNAKDFVSSITP